MHMKSCPHLRTTRTRAHCHSESYQTNEDEAPFSGYGDESLDLGLESPNPQQRRSRRLANRKPMQNMEPIPIAPPPAAPHNPQPVPRCVILHVLDRYDTPMDTFRVWRHYPRRPTRDPDFCIRPSDLAKQPPIMLLLHTVQDTFHSYMEGLAPTVRRLMTWANNGQTTKSHEQINELVHDVLLADDFNPKDLIDFEARNQNAKLDQAIAGSALRSQFTESSVDILVPSGTVSRPPVSYTIPGLLHRSITFIISEFFTGPLGHLVHYSPFVLKQQSASNREERLFSEVYNSDAFLEKHGLLPPGQEDCQLERVVAAVMPLSDATHFTNFGNAKAWPIYLMLGNISKYVRAVPGSGALQHLAYIPSLPDSFKDFAAEHNTKWKTQKSQILTHSRRELMHSIWCHLLDDEFVYAYKYGMVIRCIDGIMRRIYPRIFTYSADYPEKVLLATIRDKGMFPCPRCMVHRSKLDLMGLYRDLQTRVKQLRTFMVEKVKAARDLIYRQGYGIKSQQVEDRLQEFSGVPTQNAFVERLNLDPSPMLAPDILHEFELGVWKSLFTHLIRILYAASKGSDDLVSELDKRYRLLSTFGQGTIRNFSNNSSEMKKLAGRDFEDLLQCAVPVFEGLLPEADDYRLRKLLYRTAEWHGLAKMRIHTEGTLTELEKVTTELGKLMRGFRDLTCSHYDTHELPREIEARTRREGRKSAHASTAAVLPSSSEVSIPTIVPKPTRKPIKLNLFTIKWHFLGDYVEYIRRFGTTDSYSTQLGELAHRLIKSFYRLTNKKDANKQISKKYNRMNALQSVDASQIKSEKNEADAAAQDNKTHYISKSQNQHPAKVNFLPKLQNHLLARLLGQKFDGDTDEMFTNEDRYTVRIVNNTMYRVNTLRVNFTTYDMQRSYDTVSRNQPFIMLHSPETEPGTHPFWYASVMGVFHAQVQHIGPLSTDLAPQRMEFLWVRWLGIEPGYKFGRKQAKLPKVGFVPDCDEMAYGFLDPSLVIRGCHLLPSFVDGRTNNLLTITTPTEARCIGETDDWCNYYIGIFVDRDMLSRHFGTGVGHTNRTGAADIDDHDNDDDDETMEDCSGMGEFDSMVEVDTNSSDESESGGENSESDTDLSEGDNGYDDL
ncbi:hypothetical protein JR316_0011703 [Psilocybe cubensis]|uniref:Uncharacterized protein n=1 Tax=Psilocybe cubensis TaxID=181762 RepID=A0ACB8GL60_PSICU|nr:hypothetical protein JR316_0011703 [Psilocybe cubensis]KAH9476132.1 hypothetical protein JR316_0011703 [Psilocybe cubensis]